MISFCNSNTSHKFSNIHYDVISDSNIHNIVSIVDLCCDLDLKTIAFKARNAKYNPKCFQVVIMKLREPKSTALVFNNGKLVVVGAKNEELSKTAAKKFAMIIKQIGFNEIKFKNFTIHNIVASYDVKFSIKLDKLYVDFRKNCSYEPLLFPGLTFYMHDPNITILIFASGKIVLTGAKKKDNINRAIFNIIKILNNYEKN